MLAFLTELAIGIATVAGVLLFIVACSLVMEFVSFLQNGGK